MSRKSKATISYWVRHWSVLWIDQRGFTALELLVLSLVGGYITAELTSSAIHALRLTEIRIEPAFSVAKIKDSQQQNDDEKIGKAIPILLQSALSEIYAGEKLLNELTLKVFDPPMFKQFVGAGSHLGLPYNATHPIVKESAMVKVREVAKTAAETYGGRISESAKEVLSDIATFPVDVDEYSLSGSLTQTQAKSSSKYRVSVDLRGPHIKFLKFLSVPPDTAVYNLTKEDLDEGEIPLKVHEIGFEIAQKFDELRDVTLLQDISYESFKSLIKGVKTLTHKSSDSSLYKYLEDAKGEFKKAQNGTRHPLPWIGHAIAAYHWGDYDTAKESFMIAKAMIGDNSVSHDIPRLLPLYGLGLTYHRLNSYAKSEKYFKEAEKQFQSIHKVTPSVSIPIQLGLLYSDRGDLDNAQKKFEEAVEHAAESNVTPDLHLAEFYMARSHLEKQSQAQNDLCGKAMQQYWKYYEKLDKADLAEIHRLYAYIRDQ